MDTLLIDVQEQLRTIPDAIRDAEEETGRLYPHEFIGTLAETCGELVDDWLRTHGAPEAIVDLFQYAVMLERCAGEAKLDSISTWNAVYLAQEVPSITRRIIEAGGTFRSPAGESRPRPAIEFNSQKGEDHVTHQN